MREILVTGSSGFIGNYLVHQLLNQNYKVFGISKRKQKSFENFISHSVDISKVTNSKLRNNFSKIIHMAALSDVDYCNLNPSKCYEINVNGTQNMLEIARKNDSEFIFLSSSHVYGNSKNIPISETESNSPLSHYAASKKMSEILCETYSLTYGLDIRIARIFSVYGPNSSKSNLVFNIINQVIHNSQITLGNTTPKRDFIFIDDVIRGLLSIINSKKKGYNVYNLGTGRSTSIIDLINMILDFSNKKMRVISKKDKIRKNDVFDVCANISKMSSNFNWKPQVTLKKGLEITCKYYN
ncbi:nucleoside-diphosphate-sugar epimerase [Candidatus Nitrosarchaeum limnium SFB1]|uniref:Nucleoside-diphosphate-sugar epimerase n=1 Tax=Candidatus Nitrosarchaeum limnium SFB1 TaxID=886738 RepID=F3KN13_9ARCH|nr:nucleoside-diphosphate-sugar epimerase [Candidatus Nitrosarchaeum limnium SFB1]